MKLLQALNEKLNQLLLLFPQVQRYKQLYNKYSNELKHCKTDIFNLELLLKRQESEISDLKRKLEKKNKESVTEEKPYNEIDTPRFSLAELESTLKLADKYTMKQIAEYLRLDSYELVKNMAKIMNRDNASEVMAHRDGALQRNESLIRMLDKLSKEKIVHDRIKSEMKVI